MLFGFLLAHLVCLLSLFLLSHHTLSLHCCLVSTLWSAILLPCPCSSLSLLISIHITRPLIQPTLATLLGFLESKLHAQFLESLSPLHLWVSLMNGWGWGFYTWTGKDRYCYKANIYQFRFLTSPSLIHKTSCHSPYHFHINLTINYPALVCYWYLKNFLSCN